jgi:hypothetical protein
MLALLMAVSTEAMDTRVWTPYTMLHEVDGRWTGVITGPVRLGKRDGPKPQTVRLRLVKADRVRGPVQDSLRCKRDTEKRSRPNRMAMAGETWVMARPAPSYFAAVVE